MSYALQTRGCFLVEPYRDVLRHHVNGYEEGLPSGLDAATAHEVASKPAEPVLPLEMTFV